jgi:nitrate reductase (cytochrome), electron transfer subunit
MKRLSLSFGTYAAVLAVLTGCAASSIEDTQIGLRKADVFVSLKPMPFYFIDGAKDQLPLPIPGSGMPPMIRHAVDEHLPITSTANACLDCHDKPKNIGKLVAAGKAKPAPVSHYVRRDGSLALNGRQYTCMACHAPQAEVSPLVSNSAP